MGTYYTGILRTPNDHGKFSMNCNFNLETQVQTTQTEKRFQTIHG